MDGEARWNDKRLAFHLIIAGVLFGIIEGFLGFRDDTPDVVIFAELATINVMLFYWVVMDSRIREYATSVVLKVMVLIFGVLASFWYVARNRGLVPGFLNFLYTLGLIMLTFILADVSRVFTEAFVKRLV